MELKYTKQTIVALLFFLLLSVGFSTVGFSKPMPSLSVKMKWQGELVQEVPMTVVLSVFSHVTTDELEITLILPDGVTMLDGTKKITASITQAIPLEQSYIVQISKKATGQLKAEARVNNSGQTSFYAVTGLPVNAEVLQKMSPRSATKETFKRTQRNGEWLREYQLP